MKDKTSAIDIALISGQIIAWILTSSALLYMVLWCYQSTPSFELATFLVFIGLFLFGLAASPIIAIVSAITGCTIGIILVLTRLIKSRYCNC